MTKKDFKKDLLEFYKIHPNEPNKIYYEKFPDKPNETIRSCLSGFRVIDLKNEFDKDQQRKWLFIINKQNWEIVKKENILGTKYKKRANIIKKNDSVIIYVKIPISSIVGEYKVSSKYPDNEKLFQGEIYPFRYKLEPIKILKRPIKFKILINRLDFIRNKKSWGTHLFGNGGIKQLSIKDYETIKKEIIKSK